MSDLATAAPLSVNIDYFTEISDVKKRAVTLLGLALAGNMVAENETTPTLVHLVLHQAAQALCSLWEADQNSFYVDDEGTLARISLAGHRYVVHYSAVQRASLEIINEVVAPILKEIKVLPQQ